ncbi:MAG: hypothetical protein LBH68_04100 [Bifidobacteriaceae bacterium]|nr:hypothetical protein [Bifidobacteriaceae bacterium]
MSFAFAGALVLAAAWLWLPGGLIGYAVGLRRLALVALAPALTLAAIGCGTVVAPWLGLRWNWVSAIGAVLVATVIAWVVGALFKLDAPKTKRRWGNPPPGSLPPAGQSNRDGASRPAGGVEASQDGVSASIDVRALPRWSNRQWLGVISAGLGAGAFGLISSLVSLGRPDGFSQRWDTPFHGNLVRFIIETGQASPLQAGTLNAPDAATAYYPSGFHAIAALEPSWVGVWPAVNAVWVVGANLIWIVGLIYLARAIFPARPSYAVLAAIAGAAVQSAPASMTYLLPNSLAFAVLPALIGWTVQLARIVTRESTAWAGRLTVGAVGLVGACFAHPNALFSYVVLAWPLAGHIMKVLTVRLWRFGTLVWRALAVGLWVVAVGAAAAAAWALLGSAAVQSVVAYERGEASLGLIGAIATGLADATSFLLIAGIAPGLGVILGMVRILRTKQRRWLVASWAGAFGLYVAAATRWTWLAGVTGLWYHDRSRLGVVLGIATIPLAVAGYGWMWDLLRARRAAQTGQPSGIPEPAGPGEPARRLAQGAPRPVARTAPRPSRARALAGATLAVAAVAALVVAIIKPIRFAEGDYALVSDSQRPRYVNQAELDLIKRLPGELEPGKLVLGNPANGSVLIYSISGQPVVFTHVAGAWGKDRKYILDHFQELETNNQVCQTLNKLNVGYFYADPVIYRGMDQFDSLRLTEQVGPGLELVDQGGGARIYQITACV